MRKMHSQGFTLIELIAAMTIAVILGGAVYGTLSAGLKSKQKGNSIAQNNQIARSVLEIIQNDLLSASVSSTTPSWTFTAAASTMSAVSTYTDSLQFIATNQPVDWSAAPVSDEAIITYAIGTVPSVFTPNSNSIGIVRTINKHITTPTSTDITNQLISPTVVSLHFQYYDGTQWTSDWTNTSILPQSVQIYIGIKDADIPSKVDFYMTQLRLPKA